MRPHRLDAVTGGILMVAKTRPALQALCTAFAQREVNLLSLAYAGTVLVLGHEEASADASCSAETALLLKSHCASVPGSGTHTCAGISKINQLWNRSCGMGTAEKGNSFRLAGGQAHGGDA